MKKELSKEEEILNALEDLKVAYLADMKANKKVEEVNREKTKSHYNLLEAKKRLGSVDIY